MSMQQPIPFLDWIVRTHVPAFMRLANMPEHAGMLEALPEITRDEWALPMMVSARNATRAEAGAKSWDTGWYAVLGPVSDAAAKAAQEAVWAAAGVLWPDGRDAAMAHARASVGAGAGTSAWDTAWDAARAAAFCAAYDAALAAVPDDSTTLQAAAAAALAPTVEAVRASAIELRGRLGAAGEAG